MKQDLIHHAVTDRILKCALEVHRELGPGLLESNYHAALAIEFQHSTLAFVREPTVPVVYRGVEIGHHRPDFIVEECVVVEVKSVEKYDPVFTAQVLTYLRITNTRVGLILNFNRPVLRDGINRVVL